MDRPLLQRALHSLSSSTDSMPKPVAERVQAARQALHDLLADAAQAPSARAGSEQRIVVADDDPLIRQALVRALSRTWTVLEARDGDEAWALIQSERPDGVVMDVNMPGLHGTEVTRRVRADPSLAHTPVLLVTARTSERNTTLGLDSGADEYIHKPFRGGELRVRLQRALDKAAAAKATSHDNAALKTQLNTAAELLHDMGNVVTGVGITASELGANRVDRYVRGIERAGQLASEELASDSRAARLPEYLSQVAVALAAEQQRQTQAVESLQQCVQALHRLLRGTNDRDPSVREIVVPAEVLSEAVVLAAGHIDRAGATVVVEPTDVDPLWVGRDDIQHIVVNLLKNAAEAVADGPDRTIRVRAVQTERDVATITVEDSGVGMDAQTLARIFDRGVSSKGAGRGLGLASVRRLAEGLGGRVTAESRGPSTGSTFSLRLPTARASIVDRRDSERPSNLTSLAAS